MEQLALTLQLCSLPSVGLRMRTHADDVHMDIDHQPCEMSILNHPCGE